MKRAASPPPPTFIVVLPVPPPALLEYVVVYRGRRWPGAFPTHRAAVEWLEQQAAATAQRPAPATLAGTLAGRPLAPRRRRRRVPVGPRGKLAPAATLGPKLKRKVRRHVV